MLPNGPLLPFPAVQVQNALVRFDRGVEGDLVLGFADGPLPVVADRGDQQRSQVDPVHGAARPFGPDFQIRPDDPRNELAGVQRMPDQAVRDFAGRPQHAFLDRGQIHRDTFAFDERSGVGRDVDAIVVALEFHPAAGVRGPQRTQQRDVFFHLVGRARLEFLTVPAFVHGSRTAAQAQDEASAGQFVQVHGARGVQHRIAQVGVRNAGRDLDPLRVCGDRGQRDQPIAVEELAVPHRVESRGVRALRHVLHVADRRREQCDAEPLHSDPPVLARPMRCYSRT